MKTLKTHAAALLILTAFLPTMARAQESSEPLVTIGGETISQSDYIQALEAQTGRTVMQKLVYGVLIRQAAVKAGVTPTDAELGKRLAALQRRTPQVLPDATRAPDRWKQFCKDLTLDLALENLRLQNISVTDVEVRRYYAAHAVDFQLPPQARTTMVVTESSGTARAAEALLRTGSSEVAVSHKPGFRVVGLDGYQVNMDLLSLADKNRISNLVFQMKPKQVRTLKVQSHYLTFRINQQEARRTPPLAQVMSEVVRAAKLAKAPSTPAMIQKLYLQAPPTFQNQRYQQYFDGITPNPNIDEGH